ncbi:serine protease [uncultured Ruegeria sp.]|uniref:S1 family peptidase n=1 Tax=uncultured Ruegeria sp. TaxID=259304 RepID=UPI00261C3A00|nr:serine protease [uncultured Ruegeria sp.]
MSRLDDEVLKFVERAQDGRRTASAKSLHGLTHRLLEQEDDELSDDDLQMVVSVSMKERFFEEVDDFLESMNVANRLSSKNRLDMAQVSIELGRYGSGIALLDVLAIEFADDPVLFAEAKGISGRAHKDLFLNALKGNRVAAQLHMKKSLQRYKEGCTGAAEKRNWLIGNLLAVGTRARIEGFELPFELDFDALADEIEESTARLPEEDRGFYVWSSLAEARISREDWNGVSDAVSGMLATHDVDVFKLSSTLRQFKTVWALPRSTKKAKLLVTGLERAILNQANGEVHMDASDIRRQRQTNEGDLEAQFSNALLRGRGWMLKFLEIGNSIVSVVDLHSGAVRGTCCIMNGGDLAPELDGKLLGLTNDHVISEYPQEYETLRPLRPQDAAVRFTLSDNPKQEYEIDEVIWSSPFRHHDACLFSFKDALPIDASNFEIIEYLPPAPQDPPAEVFVVSHPNPDEPSYSFQNTDLLMHDGDDRGSDTLIPGRIHYTTGTIKGSSGGVALNAKLKMIGLHHAGSDELDRIDGEPGHHAANEAIWIVAILNAIRDDLSQGRTRSSAVD